MHERIVGTNESGQRLDRLLARILKNADKSFIYKMLRKKNIKLNGAKAEGNEKVSAGDVITIYFSDETFARFTGDDAFEPVPFDLDIIYEDANIAVINKKADVLSQKAGKDDVSLNEMFISYLLDKGEIKEDDLTVFRPAVCNRLDRNTTGLIIAGKTITALRVLSDLLKSREIGKHYKTIVKGVISKENTIRGWLKKDESHNTVRVEDRPFEGAYEIVTRYEPVSCNGRFTLLDIELITGKSHQIRAHLSSIGHQVAGDGKYGDKETNRYFKNEYGLKHQLLHSETIMFPDIEGELSYLSGKTFKAPLPAEFIRIKNGEGL